MNASEGFWIADFGFWIIGQASGVRKHPAVIKTPEVHERIVGFRLGLGPAEYKLSARGATVLRSDLVKSAKSVRAPNSSYE